MNKIVRYVLIAVAFLALVAVAVAIFLCPGSTTDETSPTDTDLPAQSIPDNESSPTGTTPSIKSIPIDGTLQMVKLDTDGNELGTFDVHFTGEHLVYLFDEDCILLTIDPFDGMKNIKTTDTVNDEDGRITRFGKEHGLEYCQLILDAGTTYAGRFEFVFIRLYFTEEMDRIALACNSNGQEWTYVASISGQYTTEEIVDHFGGLIHAG